MRAPASHARAISRGAKTTIRVPVDTRLTAVPLRPARRHSGRPFNPKLGDILTIHGGHYASPQSTSTTDPAKPAKPVWNTTDRIHCKITAVARSPLGTLNDTEAQAEGYDTAAQFEIAWTERHSKAWLDKQIQYLIDHDTPEPEAHETRPMWARQRYEDYWQNREVWLLVVEPFDDMPVLLGNGREQYVESTSQAITAQDDAPEPEAIPPERIHMRWGIKSGRRYQDAKDLELRTRDAKQLARRVKLMKLNEPDAPEIAVIEEQLRQLEQRYSQAA